MICVSHVLVMICVKLGDARWAAQNKEYQDIIGRMGFSSDTETEDEQDSKPKEALTHLRMRAKMLEDELSEQRTLVS